MDLGMSRAVHGSLHRSYHGSQSFINFQKLRLIFPHRFCLQILHPFRIHSPAPIDNSYTPMHSRDNHSIYRRITRR